jgi:hypothetical protein
MICPIVPPSGDSRLDPVKAQRGRNSTAPASNDFRLLTETAESKEQEPPRSAPWEPGEANDRPIRPHVGARMAVDIPVWPIELSQTHFEVRSFSVRARFMKNCANLTQRWHRANWVFIIGPRELESRHGWIKKRVMVATVQPNPDPCLLACTFHWSAGATVCLSCLWAGRRAQEPCREWTDH